MNSPAALNPAAIHLATDVAVVGAGPVGSHFISALNAVSPGTHAMLIGAEPHQPYDRVGLSTLLAGEIGESELTLERPAETGANLRYRFGAEIVSIDRDQRYVLDAQGNTVGYERLVLALGSSARWPNIPGLDKAGVYTFRNLDDAELLAARRLRARRVVVIGGGLLGLETARAMRRFNTRITIVEHTPRLMFNQLDERAAAVLRTQVERLGISVITGTAIVGVRGGNEVEAVRLASGELVPCDTIIVAAGINPNIALARDAGLAVGRGIRVDDKLRTNDPRIYAIGECAEHRDIVYGLIAPGREQAEVAARVIAQEPASYRGSSTASRLKVLGVPVSSHGDVIDSSRPVRRLCYSDTGRVYRMLAVDRGRLIGACSVGEWPEGIRVQDAVQRAVYLWPWQQRRFMKTGSPWPRDAGSSVAQWPSRAMICNCTNVNRGAITNAIREGCGSVAAIRAATGASGVCGSCTPLVEQLLGGSPARAPVRAWRALLVLAALTLVAATWALVAPSAPYAQTVQLDWNWNELWYHTAFKEWSGYALLAVSLVGTGVSLRKRLPELHWGSFHSWRMAHVVLGIAVVTILFLHTGFRTGSNLNTWLMVCFTLVLASGALFSWIIGSEHLLSARLGRELRRLSLWTHILVLWPLPVLVSFHVLKTYYF